MPGTNVKLQKMGYLYNILPVVQKMLKRGNSKHKKTILEREAYFPCQKQLRKNFMSLIHSNNATVVPIAEYSMVLLIYTHQLALYCSTSNRGHVHQKITNFVKY